LAAKVEESPKRVDKVISECIELKNASSQSGRLSTKPTSLVGGSGSGEGASSSISPKAGGDGAMDQKGDEFMKLKERILLLERIHLHTIGFDLFVEHPYKFIVEKVKTLTIGRKLKYKDGTTVAEATKSLPPSQLTQKMSAEIMQYSINFANDSLFTSLCLQFGPDQIATSSLFMACCYADIEPLNGPDEWMDVLDHPDLEALVSICEQVLDTLDKKRGSDINKNNKIRTMLDVWRVSASSGVGREDVNGSSSKHPASTPPPSAGSPKRMRTEP
jgi:cyclin T